MVMLSPGDGRRWDLEVKGRSLEAPEAVMAEQRGRWKWQPEFDSLTVGVKAKHGLLWVLLVTRDA